MSKERIIPIVVEKSDDDDEIVVDKKSDSDTEKSLSQPMEELTIQNKKPKIQVKTVPNKQEEYLKEFDVFEEQSKCTLPSLNIPEKIILVIDQAQDENYTPFKLGNKSFTPLSMLKRAVQVFIKLKNMINKNHEFAVIILNTNNAVWYVNFTSDIRKMNSLIDKIQECEVEDTFRMNAIFDEIIEDFTLPEVRDNIPPPYIIRTVLFYGRSYTIPKLELTQEVKSLLEHPYFICDVLMTHEPVDKDNHCKKIIESLQNLDQKGYSYFFPVGRDERRLHTCIAKLLSHPLQRPCQKLQKN